MARVESVGEVNIQLTEQTVRELMWAIGEAKELDKLPDGIRVKSEYAKVSFQISLEIRPHSQESVGYKKTEDIYYNPELTTQSATRIIPKEFIEGEKDDQA